MPINMGRILVVDPESFLKNPVEEHGYHAPQIGVPPLKVAIRAEPNRDRPPIDQSHGRQRIAEIVATNHIGDPKTQFIDHRGELVCDKAVGTTYNHISTAIGIVLRHA
jgi:hypothetical protein